MIRKIAVTLTALTVALLPAVTTVATATAAPPATPAAAQAQAPAPDLATCQKTFHARPTSTGLYSDPCAHTGGSTANYNYGIDVKWFWECSGGCHITNALAVLRICHRTDDPDTSTISVDAVSLNFWVTKVPFMHFAPGGPEVQACDTLNSPFVGVKGCGSGDAAAGAYPQVVSIMSAGRGTLYALPGQPFPDFLRIPTTGDGLFKSNESYYLIGRGGSCT